MKYRVQTLQDDVWVDLKDLDGNPYEYDTAEEAQVTVDKCRLFMPYDSVRMIPV